MPTATANTTWKIDAAHSSAQFSVRHLMIANVRGEFTSISGSIQFDEANPANAKVEAEIEAGSINTHDEQRDTDLKSERFFHVEKFPKLTFRSTEIRREGSDWKVTGDLTIRGVTRPVTLDVEVSPEAKDPWGGTRIAATATARINRKDFGLTWNAALEAGGVLVGDDVKLTLDIEAVKQ